MSARIETRVPLEAGFASREAAVLVAALAEVHRLVAARASGWSTEFLGWQPAPGMNTAGMLLAHMAVAETHLAQVGLLGERDGHVQDVIGISVEEEGMPLAADAPPSPALAGRDAAWFLAMLDRSLAHVRLAAAPLTDDAVAGSVQRPPRADGTVRVFDRRWVLTHMVEHMAAHWGQCLLLERLHGLRR
jgi:hypothetical protein